MGGERWGCRDGSILTVTPSRKRLGLRGSTDDWMRQTKKGGSEANSLHQESVLGPVDNTAAENGLHYDEVLVIDFRLFFPYLFIIHVILLFLPLIPIPNPG